MDAPPGTWAALAQAVRDAQPGMYVTNMSTLRDLEGGKRVDKALPGVVAALEDRAIGYLPRPLPMRANGLVALYARGTEIGDLAQAIIDASAGEPITPGMARTMSEYGRGVADADTERQAADEALRLLASRLEALDQEGQRVRQTLKEIRERRRRR